MTRCLCRCGQAVRNEAAAAAAGSAWRGSVAAQDEGKDAHPALSTRHTRVNQIKVLTFFMSCSRRAHLGSLAKKVQSRSGCNHVTGQTNVNSPFDVHLWCSRTGLYTMETICASPLCGIHVAEAVILFPIGDVLIFAPVKLRGSMVVATPSPKRAQRGQRPRGIV